jgi:DNA processing protein
LSGAIAPRFPESRARVASLALALAPGVGCAKYRELVERFGSSERAFDEHIPRSDRDALLRLAEDAFDDARRVGSELLLLDDARYPAALHDLPNPPVILYAAGELSWLEASRAEKQRDVSVDVTTARLAARQPAARQPAAAPPVTTPRVATPRVVAIVGTRRATAYGARVTREIATQLARAGAVVLSGMARGIDAEAHVGGLSGRTAAVLGTGIDIAYPAGHRALHAEIRSRGLLLSEQPPGSHATAGSFPERNRIIAALACMTIVVEAGRKSGALITAARALDLNRIVAAVPGPIDVPQNAGSNELLRDGAQIITSAEDALALAGLTPAARSPAVDAAGPDRVIWEAVGAGAHDLDTISSVTALPAREVMAGITRLELCGAVECLLTGEIRRR